MTGLGRRTGIDPGCGHGKRYTGREAAEFARDKAIRLALPGTDPERRKLVECPRRPGTWHLVAMERPGGFPPAVAALIDARHPWCAMCGSPRDLHRHHRRVKGHGGDPRPHTDCACNGIRLCATCHAYIHDTAEGRDLAEHNGLIIPRGTVFPGSVSVLIATADGGLLKWLTCDGEYADEQPRGAAA